MRADLIMAILHASARQPPVVVSPSRVEASQDADVSTKLWRMYEKQFVRPVAIEEREMVDLGVLDLGGEG